MLEAERRLAIRRRCDERFCNLRTTIAVKRGFRWDLEMPAAAIAATNALDLDGREVRGCRAAVNGRVSGLHPDKDI